MYIIYIYVHIYIYIYMEKLASTIFIPPGDGPSFHVASRRCRPSWNDKRSRPFDPRWKFPHFVNQLDGGYIYIYPLVNIQIAIENDHL